jgi:hypothetical protein
MLIELHNIECKLGIVREDYSRIRQLFIVGHQTERGKKAIINTVSNVVVNRRKHCRI